MKKFTNSVFLGISEQEFEQICQINHVRTAVYKKGRVVLHSGEMISEIGIVLKGSVNTENDDLCGCKTILSNIKAGQIFAEEYALFAVPLMVDIVAAEDSEVLFLDIRELLTGRQCDKPWYGRLMRALFTLSVGKNLDLSNRIFCTSPKTIRSRVMMYLSSEAIKTKSPNVVIPFDRQQMADYLNVERSALSKELGKMQNDGLLTYKKNHFCLLRQDDMYL